MRLLCILLISVGVFSCAEKQYGGENIINYPDLENVFYKYVDSLAPINYMHVHQVGQKKDSSDMPYGDLPWAALKQLIDDANLQKEKLNFKYSVSVLSDSATNSRTLFYQALDPESPTRSLTITSGLNDDQVQNLYLDYDEKSMFSTRHIRLLLIPKKLIQIQKRKKDETIVDSYYYPN